MPLKPACIMCCSDCDASAVLTDCQHFLCARCFAKYGPSGKCPRCDRPCRTVQCGSSKFPKDIMERIRADPHKMLKQTLATLEFHKKHEDLSVVRLKELVTILNNSNRNLSGQVQSLQAELSKARDAHNALTTEVQALRHATASSSTNHHQQQHQQSSYNQYQQPPPPSSSSAAAGYSSNNPPPPQHHHRQEHYPPPTGGGDQTPTSWGRTGGGGGGGKRDRDRPEDAEAIRPHRPSNNGTNYQQQTRTPPRSTPTGQAPPPPHQQVLECMTPLLQLTNTVREAKRAQHQTLPQHQNHQQQFGGGGGGGGGALSRRSVSSHGESEGARAAPAMTGMDAFRLATPAITLRNGIAPNYPNTNNNNPSSQDLGGYAAPLHPPPNNHHNPHRGPNDSPQPQRGGGGGIGGGGSGKPQLHSHLLQHHSNANNTSSSAAYGRGGGVGAPSGLTVTALAEHNMQVGGGGGVSPPGAAYVAGAPLPRLLPR